MVFRKQNRELGGIFYFAINRNVKHILYQNLEKGFRKQFWIIVFWETVRI